MYSQKEKEDMLYEERVKKYPNDHDRKKQLIVSKPCNNKKPDNQLTLSAPRPAVSPDPSIHEPKIESHKDPESHL